jgi:beta-galactosidase/beta-glucuronidase
VVTVPANGTFLFNISTSVANCELWSVARPYLYTVRFAVMVAGVVTDTLNVTTGARSVHFDSNNGLFLNERHVKVRGFCDHSTFGGVGAAVPDRVNLFRVQALRGVGANAWRMAHNPPVPSRLNYMDALGMLCLDENREYGGAAQQGGTSRESPDQQVGDMADLVQRDRNHPSIMAWSFCNEGKVAKRVGRSAAGGPVRSLHLRSSGVPLRAVGCNNESAAKPFREITYEFDGTRPVTQNHDGTNLSTQYLDVQGFSHRSGRAKFRGWGGEGRSATVVA